MFTTEPRLFGSSREIDWVPEDPATKYQRGAAILQHRFALAIRTQIRDQGPKTATGRRTLEMYAEAKGQSPDRLSRVLRGVDVMRLEDLARAALHLGVTVSFQRRERDDQAQRAAR